MPKIIDKHSKGLRMINETDLEKAGKEQGVPTGLPLRMGAFLYDALLIVSIWMITLWIWILVNQGEAIYGWAVQMVLLAEVFMFYGYCWRNTGQTLGMRAWHIQLVDEKGGPPSLKQISVRLVTIPFSLSIAGLGFIWFYIGDRRQTWHDRLSQTFVVKLSKNKKS